MMDKGEFLSLIKNQLIVSSQAYPGDSLYGSDVMAKMSLAAKEGGAVAIRANGRDDIIAIKKSTKLPTIGIVKRKYKDSEVYITPTLREVTELIDSGTEVIALDATKRDRPNKSSLRDLITYIKKNSDILVMGDVSTVTEGVAAIEDGCDFVSTTLSGYTSYSRSLDGPDFTLIEELTLYPHITVIAEGKISTPEDVLHAYSKGAHSVVVGTAITRPEVITSRFVKAIKRMRTLKKS